MQASRGGEQGADTLDPACPSNTANQETVSFWSGISITAEWASSISILQPCMEERPYLSPPPTRDSLYFSVLGLSRKAPILAHTSRSKTFQSTGPNPLYIT